MLNEIEVNMETELYIKCFVVALVGMSLQTVLKLKSLKSKAKVANVQFSISDYFREDWLSISASLLTIIMVLLFIDEVFNINQKIINYIKIGFAFVGYTGSDIASRLFSVVNKKINDAIDYKTTLADTATNNLDNPTPK